MCAASAPCAGSVRGTARREHGLAPHRRCVPASGLASPIRLTRPFIFWRTARAGQRAPPPCAVAGGGGRRGQGGLDDVGDQAAAIEGGESPEKDRTLGQLTVRQQQHHGCVGQRWRWWWRATAVGATTTPETGVTGGPDAVVQSWERCFRVPRMHIHTGRRNGRRHTNTGGMSCVSHRSRTPASGCFRVTPGRELSLCA